MNKKTLVKKLSSLLIILAILIQMFPISTYAQENATRGVRTRHVRSLRTAITYAKFQIVANTGVPINGQVGYKLIEVNGSQEKVFKDGKLNTSNKEVEFTGMKLNTTYKLFITSVPPGFDRPVLSVAEFYFDASGIHFTKGNGGVVITQNTLEILRFTVTNTSGQPVKPVTFELKKEVPGGFVPLNITAKAEGGNDYSIELNKRDIEFGKTYKMYITSVPNQYQLPTTSISEFHFTNEGGKLYVRFTKGGTSTELKKVGEQDKPLAANEYYGFIGFDGELKVSKDYDNSLGTSAFCFRVEDTFPVFGDKAVYTEYINDVDALYRAAQNPRVNKKELYDVIRQICYYCETHKDELLTDYHLGDPGFWNIANNLEKDFGYYNAMQEAMWYYSNSLNDLKDYNSSSNEYYKMKSAVSHILSESKNVSAEEMKSVKIKTYIAKDRPRNAKPYQALVAFELKKTTKINVIKVDESGTVLNGAVFKLEKLNDASFSPVFVGRNQQISEFKFEGLSAGDYRLTEEKAPTGYKLLGESIDFTIAEQGSKFTITQTSNNPLVTLDGSSFTFKVKNEKLKTRITVNKKWFDADGQEVQRPAGTITYNLMQISTTANGTTTEKVYKAGETLTAAGNWTKTYTDLPVKGKAANGEEITYGYYVVETAMPDYTADYSNNNGVETQTPRDAAVSSGTITIRNTENPKFSLPETGGLGRTVVYITGVILVIASAAVITIRRKNRL